MKRTLTIVRRHGNCQVCGTELDGTGFCWKCAGEGEKPTPTVAAPQLPPTVYPPDIRQLIRRALYCACLPDKSLAVQICRELEKRIPGVGWSGAANELEAMRVKRAERRPMAETIGKVLSEVPF